MKNESFHLVTFYAECLQPVCCFDERMDVVAARVKFERGVQDLPFAAEAADF